MHKTRRAIAVFSTLVALPLLFNLIVMWREVGAEPLADAIRGTYECYGLPCNPMPRVILALSGLSLLVALFGVFMIHTSTRGWLERLPTPLALPARGLLAVTTAIVFRFIAGLVMPLVWLPAFGDYLLGLPMSPTAQSASWYLVFPLAFLIFMISIASKNAFTADER